MSISLRERVYHRIRDDITYGTVSPGERLIEDKLAKEFKASRTPIREALRQLESEGLIEFERNKGITVSKLSIKQVEEIYSLRWLLESYAARLCAERATKDTVTRLRDLHEELKAAAQAYDLRRWLDNNTLFHNLLSENSGNSSLITILDMLKRRVYRYKFIIVRIPGYFSNYIEQHEGILRGCEKRDGEMAEQYMKLHIEKIKEVLIDYLGAFPSP